MIHPETQLATTVRPILTTIDMIKRASETSVSLRALLNPHLLAFSQASQECGYSTSFLSYLSYVPQTFNLYRYFSTFVKWGCYLRIALLKISKPSEYLSS